jgi:molybdopterin/thiamine biosynthesis adenylyltransferase
MNRYSRNGILSQAEGKILSSAKVCIIGCGGLGGYVLEMLCRIGIGHITVIDHDVFDETNLNRQLLSSEDNLNTRKVDAAIKRMKVVNSTVEVQGIDEKVTEDNVEACIRGHDVVVDALDSINTRLLLESACEQHKIPLVHGAIAGWYGQVSTIYPGDRLLARFYKASGDKGIEKALGNPSFTPATVASIQVSETVKVLLKYEEVLRHRILMIDLKDNDFNVIEFTP